MTKYLANSDDITIEEVTGTDSIKFNTKYSMDDLKNDIDLNTENIANICENSQSSSQTKPYSANYVNNLVDWKLAGQVTGNSYITIPSEAKEIFLITEESSAQQYTKYMLVKELKSMYYCYNGYYISSSNNAGCAWQYVNSNGIRCANCTRNGTAYVSNSTTKLYYR